MSHIQTQGNKNNQTLIIAMEHEKPSIYQYEAIQKALVDLYLSVKIRKADEVEEYNESLLEEERNTLQDTDPLLLIGYIKTSVEILMNLKAEDQELAKKEELPSFISEKSQSEPPKKYEEMLQKLEDETEQQLKLCFDDFQEKQEEDERNFKRQSFQIKRLKEENQKLKKELNELKPENEKLRRKLGEVQKEAAKLASEQDARSKRQLVETGVGPSKPANTVKDEYLRLLNQMKEHRKPKNDNKTIADILKRGESLGKVRPKTQAGSIKETMIDQSNQSMSTVFYNISSVLSNVKGKPQRNTRMAQTSRKEKGRTRGNSVLSNTLRTERSLRNVTNKIEKLINAELPSGGGSLKKSFKKDRPHTYSVDNPHSSSRQKQVENQKRSTQSLLKMTSKMFGIKGKGHLL